MHAEKQRDDSTQQQALERMLLHHHINTLNHLGDRIRFTLRTHPPGAHTDAMLRQLRQRCADVVQALGWDENTFVPLLQHMLQNNCFRPNGHDHFGPVIALCALCGHTPSARAYWQKLSQSVQDLLILTAGDALRIWISA